MGGVLTQLLPSRPEFTERNVKSLTGKVFVITGGNSGIGLELAKLLYAKGATVYIAARSRERIATAIAAIETVHTPIRGALKHLIVDFADLETIASAAREFLNQEDRLDVLFNNAGVAQIPPGSTTAQGYEVHMGTNCVGPYLFTKMLGPLLLKTAASAPKASVRVVWTSSGIVDMAGPPGGLDIAKQAAGAHSTDKNENYSASKAGDWFLASELDKRSARGGGVVSIAINPGMLRTKGWDKAPFLMRTMMRPFMYGPQMGAYTMLWAGMSPDITLEDGGRFAVPWGRWHPEPRKDCLASMKSEKEGGTGLAARFWDWCEAQTAPFV